MLKQQLEIQIMSFQTTTVLESVDVNRAHNQYPTIMHSSDKR